MVMQMLEAGGMETLMDEHLVADIDNPGGYYEYEPIRNIEWDSSWVGDAMGKAFKLLAAGVRHLPTEFKYKLIYITRDADEMRISLKKLLIRKGVDPDLITQAETDLRRDQGLISVQRWAKETDNELLIVDYNETLKNPYLTAQCVRGLLDIPAHDGDRMADTVQPDYYHNRVVGL